MLTLFLEKEMEREISMLKREDLLELTRRMTPKRTCFSRIAGAYVDEDGLIDGTFNIHFGKLSASEKDKNLKIAKSIPFASTNEALRAFRFTNEQPGSMWQLLMGLRQCGLKNDALLETFYEYVGEHIVREEPYAIYLFYGSYDVPVKAKDHVRLEDSEEVYDFLICAICPMLEEYEPDFPECGFLFPAFVERSTDLHQVAVFQGAEDEEEFAMLCHILCCE